MKIYKCSLSSRESGDDAVFILTRYIGIDISMYSGILK
jgi:hypothetical protein